MLPETNRFRFCPVPSTTGYVLLSEEALVEILGHNDLKAVVAETDKGSIFQQFFGSKIGRPYILVKDYGTSEQRFVLKNVFRTNGLVLQAMVIDLAEKVQRWPQNSIGGMDDIQLQVCDSEGGWASADQSADQSMGKIEMDVTKVTEASGSSNPPKRTLRQPPPAPPPQSQSVPSPVSSDRVVIGIDLGKRYTIGACALGGDIRGRRNLTIKYDALNEPRKLYERWLEQYKENSTTNVLKAEEEPVARQEAETLEKYLDRMLKRWSVLYDFYGSTTVMKRTWDMRKALRGQQDKAISAVIRMIPGANSHEKTTETANVPIFAVGDGKFSTTASYHESVSRRMLKKVRALGYKAIGLDEDFTSKMCPCCNRLVEWISMRIKYCRHCHKFFHRDVMAGENMANVAVAQSNGQPRPSYLARPPKRKDNIPGQQQQQQQTIPSTKDPPGGRKRAKTR